jgi:hypothetical protein
MNPGRLSSLRKEKTEITASSLPKAYAIFGKKVYEEPERIFVPADRALIEPLIKQIDSLVAVYAQQTSPTNTVDPSKPASEWASGSTMAKATEAQLRKKYGQLGKRAYEENILPASCSNEILAVRALTNRDAELGRQISKILERDAARNVRRSDNIVVSTIAQHTAALSDQAIEAGTSILFSRFVVCSLAVLFPPLGLFLIWKHPTWGKPSKIRWTTVSAVCLLSLLMIGTTKRLVGNAIHLVDFSLRSAGSVAYDLAADNGIIVRPEDKPKWLAGSASPWKHEPIIDLADEDNSSQQQRTNIPTQLASSGSPTASKQASVKPQSPQRVTPGTIEGEWVSSMSEEFGIRLSETDNKVANRRLRISRNSLTMTRSKNGEQGSYEGTFTYDPQTKAIDWRGTGPNGRAVKLVGIMEERADVLKFCFRIQKGNSSVSRPSVFQSDTQIPTALNYEFRRSGAVAATSRPPTPPPSPNDLNARLAGSRWTNNNGAVFEWDDRGNLVHQGTAREWRVSGPLRGQIIYSDSHRDTLDFNSAVTQFTQYIHGGPDTFTGKRASNKSDAKSSDPKGVTVGNRYFKLIDEPSSWSDAKDYCELRGGRLAVIDTPQKMAAITQMAKTSGIKFDKLDGIWIGATDAAREGEWKWVNGSPLTYTNWGTGQPNNKRQEEHYAMIWTNDWTWSDQPDTSSQHRTFFLCEWER